ncbi:MAG: 6-bladed beta-propeller, partial [Tannerella sp.]|nr:6-bladed beta-propeller [Tannerella sp.]
RGSNAGIDLDSTEKISIFDIFESIDVVQLETTDDCLISSIFKVIFHDNKYYVLDLKLQTLFCFDAQGKYQFKISRRGQGPQDYIYLEDFNIDPYNNQLLLLDSSSGSLLLFELESGTFIEKVKLPREIGAYNEVYPLDKDRLFFVTNTEYHVCFYDRSSNTIIERRFETDSRLGNVFNPFYKTYIYNGDVFFSPPPTNEIINISKGTSFFWDFGKKNNTPEQISKLRKLMINEGVKPKGDYVGEGYLNYDFIFNYETARYKLCILNCGHLHFKHVFFDKKTQKAHVFDKTTENIRFIFPDFSKESVILYDRGSGYEITLPFYDEKNLTDEQKNLIKSHNPEDDNPFLVKYNFKK